MFPTNRQNQIGRSRPAPLGPDQQRILGCRFAEAVMRLSKDDRVNRAIETGLRESVSAGELEDAFKAAKAYATKTYTDCGKDTSPPNLPRMYLLLEIGLERMV